MRYISGIMVGAAALLASAGASAQVSCQLGVEGGVSMVDTTVSVIGGMGSYSSQPDVGGRVGCDYRINGSPLVVGVFAGYDYIKPHGGLIAPTSAQEIMAGGRVGYMVSPHAMPYLLVAYTHAGSVDWTVSAPGLPHNFNGVAGGGGVEFPVTKWASIALETRYVHFEGQSLGPINLQPDELQGMLRLNITLGSLLGEAAPAYRPLK